MKIGIMRLPGVEPNYPNRWSTDDRVQNIKQLDHSARQLSISCMYINIMYIYNS